MSGKPSAANDKARAAFLRSGGTLKPKDMAKRFGVALSTIYRAAWFKSPKDQLEKTDE